MRLLVTARPTFERDSLRGAGRAAVQALPVAVLVAAAARLAWGEGGSIAAADWLSTAVLLALLSATVLLAGAAVRPSWPVLAGGGALAALGVWDAVSAAWSPVPSLARDEALLAGTYALSLFLPALVTRRRDQPVATGLVVLALAGMAVATAIHLQRSGSANDVHDGRLAFPIGYPNAAASLFLVGFFPAVALAAGAVRTFVVRLAAFVGATALFACWAVTQSKGGAIAVVAAAVVVLAVSRERLRLFVPLVLAAAPVAVLFDPLTEPYRKDETPALAAAVQSAGSALLQACAAAAAVGVFYVLVDRRLRLGERARLIVSRIAVLGLAGAIALGAAAFAAAVPQPRQWADDHWREFKQLPEHETSRSHLLSLGSNRYDFWRVEVRDFERHPVGGIGARGFQSSYLLQRRSDETPARGHSVEMDALSETGAVGFVLLVVGIGVPLLCIARQARTRLAAAGALGGAVEWLVHSSGDWIWTFPAISIPALVLLGAGCTAEEPRPLRPRLAVPAGVAAVAAAVALFAPPWVAARLVERGLQNRDPEDLRLAKRFDPLTTEPYVAEAALTGSPQPLREALRKEPDSAPLHYALGLAYERNRRLAAARRELERALALDPRDELIRAALRRVERGGSP